jgi:hypothetical protein
MAAYKKSKTNKKSKKNYKKGKGQKKYSKGKNSKVIWNKSLNKSKCRVRVILIADGK